MTIGIFDLVSDRSLRLLTHFAHVVPGFSLMAVLGFLFSIHPRAPANK
jgi:hypothetical protein